MTNQMRYFRRPELSGNNITKDPFGTIRGSIRRTNADGFSAQPYFPDLNIGDTLDITVTDSTGSPTSVTATFTAIDISTVLSDISSALVGGGSFGTVGDDDGTISLKTAFIGGDQYIKVTGGTGALALGFDVTEGAIVGKGGDIVSSPEGKRANSFGTAFTGRGDNLTAESVQRGMARLSSNMDVLFADIAKRNPFLRQITGTTVSTDGTFINLPASTRVFTGGVNPLSTNNGSNLSANSTERDLSPYFLLIDETTGLPSRHRVVSVTRGNPVGSPPYANATAWSGGGSTGNILGVDVTKHTSLISNIKNGRIVELTTPVGVDIVAGDFIEITGATNLSPSSNNGYRWVIERVIDTSTLEVRPMSIAELQQIGSTIDEYQPIVELNPEKDPVESYGTINIKNGNYANGVSLKISPGIPASSGTVLLTGTYNIQVWACSEDNGRESRSWIGPQAVKHGALESVSNTAIEPNGLVSRPAITANGGLVRVGQFYFRRQGKIIRIPQQDIVVGPADADGYIYIEESTGNLGFTTSLTSSLFANQLEYDASLSTTPEVHLLARWNKTSGVLTLYRGARLQTPPQTVITVGTSGDFSSLTDAIEYTNSMAAAAGENAIPQSSTYAHFEIVILSSISVSVTHTITAGTLLIRGANPEIRVTQTAALPLFTVGDSGSIAIRDIALFSTSSTADVISSTSATSSSGSEIKIHNCRIMFFRSVCNGKFSYITIENSYVRYQTGVVLGETFYWVKLKGVWFRSNAVQGQILSSSTSGPSLTPFTTRRIICSDCRFETISSDSGFSAFSHFTVSELASIENSAFEIAGSSPIISFEQTASPQIPVNIAQCYFSSGTSLSVAAISNSGSPSNSVVERCAFKCTPKANTLVAASKVLDCYFDVIDQAATANDTIINASIEASGNTLLSSVTGSCVANFGIKIDNVDTSFSTVSSNYIVIDDQNVTGVTAAIKLETPAIVQGNYVSNLDATGSSCINIGATVNTKVVDNLITIAGTSSGIVGSGTDGSIIEGNQFYGTSGSDIGLTSLAGNLTITDNISGTVSGDISIAGTGASKVLLSNNSINGTISVQGSLLVCRSDNNYAGLLDIYCDFLNSSFDKTVTSSYILGGSEVSVLGGYHGALEIDQNIANGEVTVNTTVIGVALIHSTAFNISRATVSGLYKGGLTITNFGSLKVSNLEGRTGAGLTVVADTSASAEIDSVYVTGGSPFSVSGSGALFLINNVLVTTGTSTIGTPGETATGGVSSTTRIATSKLAVTTFYGNVYVTNSQFSSTLQTVSVFLQNTEHSVQLDTVSITGAVSLVACKEVSIDNCSFASSLTASSLFSTSFPTPTKLTLTNSKVAGALSAKGYFPINLVGSTITGNISVETTNDDPSFLFSMANAIFITDCSCQTSAVKAVSDSIPATSTFPIRDGISITGSTFASLVSGSYNKCTIENSSFTSASLLGRNDGEAVKASCSIDACNFTSLSVDAAILTDSTIANSSFATATIGATSPNGNANGVRIINNKILTSTGTPLFIGRSNTYGSKKYKDTEGLIISGNTIKRLDASSGGDAVIFGFNAVPSSTNYFEKVVFSDNIVMATVTTGVVNVDNGCVNIRGGINGFSIVNNQMFTTYDATDGPTSAAYFLKVGHTSYSKVLFSSNYFNYVTRDGDLYGGSPQGPGTWYGNSCGIVLHESAPVGSTIAGNRADSRWAERWIGKGEQITIASQTEDCRALDTTLEEHDPTGFPGMTHDHTLKIGYTNWENQVLQYEDNGAGGMRVTLAVGAFTLR